MELWISLIALLIGLALGCALGYLLAQRRKGSGSAGGLTPVEASALNGQIELLQSQNKQLQGEGERAIRLDESLKAVNAQMQVLSTQAQDLQLNVTKSNSAMFEQIENMGKQNDSLVRETAKLAGALSKSQTRGQYGEAQLEMLLEGADLKEGIHFERQSYKNSGGEITRPDVKILMPGGTEIFVDSKFPFERFYEGSITEDLVERARLMKAHTEDLVGHINALAKREYQEGGSSPNFVVLFVPFESILSEALQADELLLQKAFAKNVVIATPTTMLALLRTIRYGYDRQDLAQNAEEIRELAGKLLKRIGKVHEKIEVLGERIKSSERAFNDLVATSENHLMVPARKMIKLGAPSTRSIGEIVDIDSEVRQIKSSAALESSVMNELDFENESSDAE
jgi:DNA recombination protein RmuC